MYYYEEVINGVLHYKTNPNDPLKPMSAQMLTEKLIDLQNRYNKLEENQSVWIP